MKRYIHSIALLAIFIITSSSSAAVAAVSAPAVNTDSIVLQLLSNIPHYIDSITSGAKASTSVSVITNASAKTTTESVAPQERPIFDRGLTNYQYIPRKEWIFGITASYSGFNSKDSDILLLLKDFNFTGSLFGIHPFAGYFITDNQCVGMKLGYSSTVGNMGALNLDIMDGLNLSLPDMGLNTKIYSVGIFHRAYLGLSPGGQLGVFNESSLTFESGTSHFTRGSSDTAKDTKTISNKIALTINPGISVFVLDNVSANVSVGILGLSYQQNTQYVDGHVIGKYYASGANFKINILNINIGITVHI